jgi:hypothetical protein
MGVQFDSYSKPAGPRFDVRYQPGSGYYVVDDLGRQVTPFLDTRDKAAGRRDTLKAEADAKLKRKVRPCLCCQTPFASEGIHNRMCDRCRHQSEGMA